MTAVAQGLYKTLAFKKQTGLGSSATGSGGTLVRRETATFEKAKATFTNNEINSHQQYTGDTYGTSSTSGQLNGVLAAGAYSPFLGSLCRADFAAVSAITGVSLTIAGTGPFTITRSAGSYLTDGVKIGNVVRITAGTYTGVARDINCLVTGVTATVLTVIVPNGKTLSAQGPVATSTLTVMGKKSVIPDTGQTNDYYTLEEYFSDITKSRLYTDTQVASVDIAIQANGNSTVQLNFLGLGRSESGSQQLTSPTAANQNTILSSPNAAILVSGAQTVIGTSIALKIDGQLAAGEPVIGSKTISDIVKGDVKVSGSLTALKQDETYSALFESETAASIIAVLFADTSDTSDFVGFTIPVAKLMTDKLDDGKKQLVNTFDFTAQRNSSGGAAVANDTGIITIQDSAA